MTAGLVVLSSQNLEKKFSPDSTSMNSRPLTISIAGWFLVAYGFYWLYESLEAVLILTSPESNQIIQKGTPHTQTLVKVTLFLTMGYYIGGVLFDIAIGMLILGGSNAARILYVIVEILVSLVNLRFFLPFFVFDLPIAIVVIILLFLPNSNRYFAAPA